ncbi:MAG: RNA polymerase sigma factor [Phycisphaerae bacterium]
MENDRLEPLIERARQQEPAAFAALIDLYAGRLYGYLYRLTGARAEAEDLLSELFVRLVRTLPQYEHDGRFEGWLFRIATNLARDRLRKVRRAPAVLSLDADQVGQGQDEPALAAALADLSNSPPDAPLELREETDALQQALAKLPAGEREVVMLRHFSGMSFAEIAEAMGTPRGTALARAHRGLKKLRAILEPENA